MGETTPEPPTEPEPADARPTMRAALVERTGPAESIRHDLLPVPTPGPTDVLVRVDAVAVNHVDTFVRSGAYQTPLPFPFVVGRDLVGTVAANGTGAPGFAVGDRVWTNSLGHAGRQGAASEYAVVPVDRLYRAPVDADAADLVAVLHPAATAFLAVELHGAVRPGETVLVGGAAGHVGRAAVLLAARAGARVVATARPDDAADVRSLGADDVVDYRSRISRTSSGPPRPTASTCTSTRPATTTSTWRSG